MGFQLPDLDMDEIPAPAREHRHVPHLALAEATHVSVGRLAARHMAVD